MADGEQQEGRESGVRAEELRKHGKVEHQHFRVGDVGEVTLSPSAPRAAVVGTVVFGRRW